MTTITQQLHFCAVTTDRAAEALIQLLVAEGTVQRHRTGEFVFREADGHDEPGGGHVYLVKRGRVKVTISTPTGRELVLAMKGPGELFGELSAIDGRPRSANAVTMEATEVISVPRETFLDCLEADPAHAIDLLRILAAHIREAGQRTAARVSADTRTRLAQQLIALAEAQDEYEYDHHDNTVLRISQDDLAGWIGATREATARALADLRAAGCVTTGRQRIEIVDRDGLAACGS